MDPFKKETADNVGPIVRVYIQGCGKYFVFLKYKNMFFIQGWEPYLVSACCQQIWSRNSRRWVELAEEGLPPAAKEGNHTFKATAALFDVIKRHDPRTIKTNKYKRTYYFDKGENVPSKWS